MSSHLANLEIFGAVAVCGLGLILGAVSLVSYRRLRNPRALLIGSAFLVFAAKGAWLIRESWLERGGEDWLLPVALMDLAILALLYAALRLP